MILILIFVHDPAPVGGKVPTLPHFWTYLSQSPALTLALIRDQMLPYDHLMSILGGPSKCIFGKSWAFGPTRGPPPPRKLGRQKKKK